jgi:hypothetical protein
MFREGFEPVTPVNNDTNYKRHGQNEHKDGQNKP